MASGKGINKTLFYFPTDPNSEAAKKNCGRNNAIRIVDITTVQKLPREVIGVPTLRVGNRYFYGKDAIDACTQFASFATGMNLNKSVMSDPPNKDVKGRLDIRTASTKQQSFEFDRAATKKAGPVPESLGHAHAKTVRFEMDRTAAPMSKPKTVDELMSQRAALFN